MIAGVIGTIVMALIIIFMSGCSAGASGGTKPGGDTASSEESDLDTLEDRSDPSTLVKEFTYMTTDGRVVTCLVYDGLGLSCDW